MENQIRSSLDWQVTQSALEAPLHKMKKYTNEMWNISHNIGLMVKELSKEEINCRRLGKQTRQHKEMLAKINEEITNYERMITFAVLLAG
jgi:PP-loop superfamily ATP-utilizing enzyme